MKFNGQVAIVTGGARGIGLAIARRLARDGRAIVVADVNGEGAEQAARTLATEGGHALAMRVDITASADLDRLIADTASAYGHIDVLVNNAGIMNRTGLLDVTPEIWHRTMQINLDAAFFCSQAVIPVMRKQGAGRIVNISSMSARTGGQASPPHYATSKTGLVGLTRALARVAGEWGITVNAVTPGIIDTEMIADWAPGQREWWLEQIPLKRLGTPDDVAGVVSFLVGLDAAYITGATLDVNGGYFMI
ncbi:MAG: SDR family oxidoreductase [Chloroflexi bacterium]|nr:SDR family oxidoreductase [Chloroflexota bacterium]